jgi:hypothetical protein
MPMAGQNIERREILRILAVAAAAAGFPGFQKWAFAGAHSHSSLAQIKPTAYRPVFFREQEYALVERLTDIIIPSDETPGAREAGVSEFIDLMASRDTSLQNRFRAGLMWLNNHSRKRRGKLFLALAAEEQVALLEPLAYKAKYRAGEERGRDFFDLIREYTVMGFYTTEIGLKELDFPGLRFYSESPACPHQNDPEHRHLPSPNW